MPNTGLDTISTCTMTIEYGGFTISVARDSCITLFGSKFRHYKFAELPDFASMSDHEIAVCYNDNVIYPDKVRLNCYYYRNYSFVKDIQMIFATVLGKKIEYAGEMI